MIIWRLAVGDLKRVAKDWQAAIWLLLMPLLFAYIFGSVFRGGGASTTWIPVIDLDRSQLSGLFIEQLREDGYYIEVKGPEQQMELKQKWPYGVVIPAGFGDLVLKGKAVQLTVVKGIGAADRLLEVQSRLTQAIVRFTAGLVAANITSQPWNDEANESLKRALAKPQILTVTRKAHSSLKPPPTGFYLSLPGLLVMFVLQMVITYGGVTLVNDRNKGQFSRLISAPVWASEVYAGKVLARVLLALVQASVLLLAGSLLFGVQLGEHPLFLIPVVVCFAACAGCLSLVAGLLCHAEKQVVQVAIFTSMILSAVGGCWWPIEIVPDFFKTIALCTPSYWGVHGLQSVLYFGKSYQALTLECPILLGFSLLAVLAAVPFARQIARGGQGTRK
jgi:ABC-2 type transport system permease protein